MSGKKKLKVNQCNSKSIKGNLSEKLNSYSDKFPSWRFSRMTQESQWSPYNKIDSIMDRLIGKEKMNWTEIKVSSAQESHYVYIDKIIKPARNELENMHYADDQIFSLRLSGKERLWGYIVDGVFFIIWYDPNHEICPSKPKHT